MSDGTVRQFFYSEDEGRDVASLAIGKENTMPAFGFAFYRYKHDPPVMRENVRSGDAFTYHAYSLSCEESSVYKYGNEFGDGLDVKTKGVEIGTASSVDATSQVYCSSALPRDLPSSEQVVKEELFGFIEDESDAQDVDSTSEPVMVGPISGLLLSKEVSVGAGAAIDQALTVDQRPLDDYHPEPQALMRVYFCFEPQLNEIIKRGGVRKIEEQDKGFLHGMPVGD